MFHSLCVTVTVILICLFVGIAHAEWPFSTGDNVYDSPSIADIDGDGTFELLFGSWDGYFYCADRNGETIWSQSFVKHYADQVRSSSALAELDGDPTTLEVVVGSASDVGFEGLLNFVSSSGEVLATFSTATKVIAPALIVDLENDGINEILFGDVRIQNSPPATFYCVSVVPGSPLQLIEQWSVSLLDGSVFGAPAAADFDGDGVLEIVISLGGTAGSSSDNSALFCLNAEGEVLWSFVSPGSPIYNTPAIADVDNDGALDVVVAPFHGDVHCLNGIDGSVKWIFDHSGSLLHSPAVADLMNDDGLLEVVIGNYASPGGDKLFCISHEGEELWQHNFGLEEAAFSSPGIADVDGDGDLEIAFGSDDADTVFAPAHMYLFSHTGEVIWAHEVGDAIYSSPALADLDGDGSLEIAFGCYDDNFYVLDANGDTFVPNPDTTPTDLAPWPTYRQNNFRTGFYPGPPNEPEPMPGDINEDGKVDGSDLGILLGAWGECEKSEPIVPCPADLNDDNAVDGTDLGLLLGAWG